MRLVVFVLLAAGVLTAAVPAAAQLREMQAREVDPSVLLDPYVSEKLQSASVKYGWSGAMKLTGPSNVILGVIALAALEDDNRGLAAIPLVSGAFWILLGVGVDSSAASDYELATRRARREW